MQKIISRLLLVSIALALIPDRVSAQTARASQGETLIRNATILTVTRGTLQNSDVLIRNGILGRIFATERAILNRTNLPFGVSAICVARRDRN
jgi:hypothetical protein